MAEVPVDSAPESLVVRQVPAARCVVLECRIDGMEEGFERIYKEWLRASPYERDESRPVLDSDPPSTRWGDSPGCYMSQ